MQNFFVRVRPSCRAVILGLAGLANSASAQSARFDLALGPVIRDVQYVESTNRWGGQARLGLLAGSASSVSFHLGLSASGFPGPGDAPTNASATATRPEGLGGFGAIGADADIRWYRRVSHDGPFVALGGGTARFAPGGPKTQWHGVVT